MERNTKGWDKPMSMTTVKIMECAVADQGEMKIERIGVGVGVILYSPTQKIAVGVHVLAANSVSPTPDNPAKYANTAIPFALEQLGKKGVKPPLTVAFAGGAEMMNMPPEIRMGPKIVASMSDALKQSNLPGKMEKTGGGDIRSILLDIGTGKINIT
jgi:chemotaxis protein CheD